MKHRWSFTTLPEEVEAYHFLHLHTGTGTGQLLGYVEQYVQGKWRVVSNGTIISEAPSAKEGKAILEKHVDNHREL
jgi:hypothetical protein